MHEDGTVYYLAAALADFVLGEGTYDVLGAMWARPGIPRIYPLFDFVSPKEKCWYITCADYVTLTDGTGIVVRPPLARTTRRWAAAMACPLCSLWTPKGEMTKETKWAGVFCKDADKGAGRPAQRGLCSARGVRHSYPHCALRHAADLIRPRFLVYQNDGRAGGFDSQQQHGELGAGIHRQGRFGDWLENVQDWGISRNRY